MRVVNEKFIPLGTPRRIWAVAAINGDVRRLVTLHDHLAGRFGLGDRLVYLGNYAGSSPADSEEVVDELLSFRSALLAKTGVEPSDIVHLRGPSEEAWQRLLRLQFAPVPTQAVDRLLSAGAEFYVRLYGISLHEARSIARAGSMAITRWTNHLRTIQRSAPGYEPLTSSMRRAAVTAAKKSDGTEARRVLFVPAGFDASRTLEDQGDNLWYGAGADRYGLTEGFAGSYARIVRGCDASGQGVRLDGAAVTIDGGAGYGGPLVCCCFDGAGALLEVVTIGGAGVAQSTNYDLRAEETVALEGFAPALREDQTGASLAF